MRVITILLLAVGRLGAVPLPSSSEKQRANMNGPWFYPSIHSASTAPAATNATTPTTAAKHVVAASPTLSATAHSASAAGSAAAAVSTAATNEPQPSDDSTPKPGAVKRAAQVGGFPDRVTAGIADGTCTHIEGGYIYTRSDDATYTAKVHRCAGGDLVHGGDLATPHSSCGLPAEAVKHGTLTSCVSSQPGSFVHRSWLFGPYLSTGGNDYWDMSAVSSSHPELAAASNSPYLAGWGLTFHDADTGEALGLPPIHGHHVSLYPSIGSKDAWIHEGSGGDGIGYHDFYKHGYKFPQFRGGFVLNLLAEDVRDANSPPLRWYANVSFTNMDAAETAGEHGTKVETLSSMKLDIASKSGSRFGNIEVPKDMDSFFIITGTWPTNGTIVFDVDRNWDLTSTHTHAHLFNQGWLFAGSPAELGLEDPTFGSATGCDSVPITNTRFASNVEMATYLQARCPSCFSQSFSRTNPDATTRLLCHISANMDEVDGRWYDRQMVPDCYADSIPIVKGQRFTQLVSFDGSKPTMPGYSAMDWAAEGYASQHVIWYMRYVDTGTTKQVELHAPFLLAENATFDEEHCAGDPEWLLYEYPTDRQLIERHH